MSVSQNLLSVQRRQRDDRRVYLGELESLARRLRGDAGRLHSEIEAADAAAVASLLERQGKLHRSLAELEAQITAAAAALADAEEEVRRRELAATLRTGNAARRRGVPRPL